MVPAQGGIQVARALEKRWEGAGEALALFQRFTPR